jgi:hypothetical protein
VTAFVLVGVLTGAFGVLAVFAALAGGLERRRRR